MINCITRTDAMLLVFIIFSFTLCAANPFHKYPFVFLLDVGNEELGKSDTEQIKVSVPGGNLALKYPATGEGDVIGHIRVTGIDFGTDLKASIVEGGPGYKYVVLVLTGAPGMQYDTVITIQTIDEGSKQDTTGDNTYKVSEYDANDSAEEVGNEYKINSAYFKKMSADMTQSNSNSYRYVHNENIDEIESNEDTSNSDSPGEINNNLTVQSTDPDGDEENIDSDKSLEDSNDDSLNGNDYNIEESDVEEDSNNVKDEIDRLKENSESAYVSMVPINILAREIEALKAQLYGESSAYSDNINSDKDTNNNIDYVSSVDY